MDEEDDSHAARSNGGKEPLQRKRRRKRPDNGVESKPRACFGDAAGWVELQRKDCEHSHNRGPNHKAAQCSQCNRA